MICQQCNSPSPSTATECPSCGTALAGDLAPTLLPGEPWTPVPDDETPTLHPGTAGVHWTSPTAGETPTLLPGAPDEAAATALPGGQATKPATDGPLSVGQLFGARYRIIRLLGLG